MNGLKDKVVIVAGGATGIGQAAAKRLGSEGAKVLIGDLNHAGATQTAAEIVDAGGTAEAFAFDISKESDCRDLVEAAKDHWGAVHGLYNAAADLSRETLGRDKDVVTIPIEVLRRTLDVNLIGYFFTSRFAVPAIVESGGGSIVHTTSGTTAGHWEFPAYAAAKNGVIALSRHIAVAFGKQGVRSNAIDPGITMTQNQRDSVTDEEREMLMPLVRANRYGEPEEIAAVVAFLISDEAPWINGQTLPVNSMAWGAK